MSDPVRPPMKVYPNDGSVDVVAVLEAALEKARAGKLDLALIVTLEDHEFALSYAWKDALPSAWALFVAGCEDAKHRLLMEGL